MFEHLSIDPHWVLAFRNESLTAFFKFFPFLASDTFFITVIAIGYWLNPRNLLFLNLGFLVPFSILVNCSLKSLFQIPRPDSFLHLIAVKDLSFGFPSGDVQVATVFWTAIFLSVRHPSRYLCVLPILGVFLSRVYLGVHSLYDVIGGLIAGLLIIYGWQKWNLQRVIFLVPEQRYNQNFWILMLGMVVVYALLSLGLVWSPVVFIALGSLLGVGCGLPWIKKALSITPYNPYSFRGLGIIVLCFMIVVMESRFIPILKTTDFLFGASTILKYFIIVFSILVLLPKLGNSLTESKESIT